MGSMLFERLAKSRNKERVLALARERQRVETAADVMKDPLVLEFLGLEERASVLRLGSEMPEPT
jgi:predicted nuclease of restriction endonuclease-like (RecB) superfamily